MWEGGLGVNRLGCHWGKKEDVGSLVMNGRDGGLLCGVWVVCERWRELAAVEDEAEESRRGASCEELVEV